MSIAWNKLSGTQLGKFGLGFTGTLLKSESGNLSLRNSTDTMFVSANLNTLALNNNNETSVTVAASVSTTESWSLVLPTNSGQSGQVLTTDGSGNSYWATVSGGTGAVTSVNVSGGSTGLFTQGGPITNSGTITITGTLSVSAGGTGFNSLAAGEMIYGSGPNLSMTKLSPGAAGQYLAIANTVPTWVEPPSRSIEFNYGDASPKLLLVINPPKSLITSISVVLTEVFTDNLSSITIGDSANPARFLSSSDISLNNLGTYIVDSPHKYNTSTQILLTINPGTSTTGQGLITINYQ